MINMGNFLVDETVKMPFNTYGANGESVTVTDLAVGDVRIYKDGGTTERASTSGVTLSINHDGNTGSHLVLIDTSDNDDSGFYAAGSDYQVSFVGITVATQTLNPFVGIFSIENRYLSSANIADAVWDEVLTAATHNVTSSAGRRLRQVSSPVIRDETAQGPGTGNNQIQFDTGASAVDGAYDPGLVCIVGGTGIGQCRNILEYDGTSKTATVDRNWKVNPDNTSEFIIVGDAGREHVNEGLAQGGSSTTITLNSLASSQDDTYIGQTVFIRSGAGEDQSRTVTDYDGTSKVATIDGRNWDVNPDTTSGYVMLPTQLQKLEDIESKIDSLILSVARLLGLSYENSYQHTRSYSGGKLNSAKLDLYDSKANAQTHNGTTGIVAKYTLTFTYAGSELDTMQVVRDS